jgi:hypothetical protein
MFVGTNFNECNRNRSVNVENTRQISIRLLGTVQFWVQYSFRYSTALGTVQLQIQYSFRYSTALGTVQLYVQYSSNTVQL